MRNPKLLVLLSALVPGGIVLLPGCFSSSSAGGGAQDSGTFNFDSSSPGFDGGNTDTGTSTQDATADTGTDATANGNIPTSVDFGLVGCGGAAATKSFDVKNTGPIPVTYSITIAGSAFAIASGSASGTIQPGGDASLTLSATVPASATAGTPITGSATVTTNIPGFTSVPVALSVTPQGGSLTVSPATVGFGQATVGGSAGALPVTITNVGNAPVGVSFGAPSDAEFSVTYTGAPGAATLAPNAVLPGAQANFSPTSTGQKSATAAIQTTGTMCASAANSVQLSGEGTSAVVTVGPSPLDFGLVNCGSAGTPLSVTVSNGNAFAITFNATLAVGTAYSVSPSSGSIPANGQAVLQITPSSISVPASTAPNGYGDTLTVSTNAPGVPPATVTLLETAQGAILTTKMTTTNFGGVPIGTTATEPFSVVNTGNVAAPLTVATGGGAWGATLTGTPTAAANGGSVPGTASFTPANGAGTTTLTASTTAILCAPTAPLTLTGTGESPDALVSGAPFRVAATCGGGVTQKTLTITNSGSSALTFSNVNSTTGYAQIVSSSAGVSIPPGDTGTIVIQARTPVIGTDAAGTYGDTITFTTNELGSPTHSVPVTVTIHGANLSVSPNPLEFSSCFSQGYTVTNSGNQDAVVTAEEPYPYDSSGISFDGIFSGSGVDLGAGSGISENIYANEQFCGDEETDLVVFDATGNVCIPLPTLEIDVDFSDCCSG